MPRSFQLIRLTLPPSVVQGHRFASGREMFEMSSIYAASRKNSCSQRPESGTSSFHVMLMGRLPVWLT